jgi:preprotein translocase subunit SecE
VKNPFRAVRIFYSETAGELRKATWPTRTELRDMTIVVIIGVALLGLFTSIADFSLVQVVNFFTNLAG